MQKSKLILSLAAVAMASTMSMAVAGGQDQQAPAAEAPIAAAPAPATGAAVTDDTITSAAKTALSADAQLAGLPINVTTREGVVVVSGEVPSAAAGERVLQIVAMVTGVKDVKNTLKVKASS